MASNSTMLPLRGLSRCRADKMRESVQSIRQSRRSMATEAPMPSSHLTRSISHPVHFQATPSTSNLSIPSAINLPHTISPLTVHPKVTTTIHDIPSLEPIAHLEYPATHLYLPLRKDILHRAVVFEGDATRQGTANTKWRSEVHGSNKKIRPQKGTGRARLGDKKSPMLRGGGVAFGPKPRDFSTELPRKIYDLAWRTALSARFRRGELLIVDNLDFTAQKWFRQPRIEDLVAREHTYKIWLTAFFKKMQWGRTAGRSMLVTLPERATTQEGADFFRTMGQIGSQGRVRTTDEVDVKNILEMGRVVIEKGALDRLLVEHQSDLGPEAEGASYKWLKEQRALERVGMQVEEEEALSPRKLRTMLRRTRAGAEESVFDVGNERLRSEQVAAGEKVVVV